MKSKFIIITTFIILFCLPYKTFATQYNISTFNGNGTSDAALVNRATPFAANDVLNFSADLTATSNVGDIDDVALTIDGNNYSISGAGEYSGFTLGSGANYNIKQLTIEDCSAGSNNGGAIYSTATATISGSTFTGNSAKSGGAVGNLGTLTVSGGSSFSGNTASDSGGAIYNAAISTIKNSNFSGNTASLYGGAIYNGGQLYLIADSDKMSFSGNTSGNETSNAIFTSGGSVGMNAANGGYILFDDKLNASTRSTLSINNSSSYTNYGNVIFNNDVSNYNINVYNGMLILGEYGKSTIGYLNNSDYLTLSKGILNTANGVINTNYVGDFSSTTNAGIFFDANLATGASDYLNSTGTTSGHLPIKGINILADGAHDLSILGSSVPYLTIDVSNFAAFTDAAKYTFVGTTTGGLTTTQTLGEGGLNHAVSDAITTKSYSAIANTSVSSALGAMNGTMLTIFGNEKNITSSSTAGIIVASGQTLNIYNVGTSTTAGMNGFSGANGAVVDNSGTTNIIDSTFTNNKATSSPGGVINNKSTGILNIADSYFGTATAGTGNSATYGGAIYSTGTANIVNSFFERNSVSGYGGAICNLGTLTISDCNFGTDISGTGNSAHYGGAIYNDAIGKMTLNSGNTFYNNTAVDGSAIMNVGTMTVNAGNNFYKNSGSNYGSAIYNSGNITISGCNFGSNTSETGNSATIGGGAVFNNLGSITINYSNFYYNSSPLGGAVYNYTGSTIADISDCVFTNNTSTGYGGAIANSNTGTITSISDNTFTGNSATNSGGAIYNLKTITSLTGGSFTGNSATNNGGAIYNSGNIGTINSTFKNNTATAGVFNPSGGAIYNSGTISKIGGTFENNSSYNGGAIYNKGTITEIVSGTSFTGNSGIYGGAINDNYGDITINNATFDSNKVESSVTNGTYGGAIYSLWDTNVTINNSTFNNNQAISQKNASGGALCVIEQTTLSGCTFTNNSAKVTVAGKSAEGGAITNVGTLDMSNTTFTNNTADTIGGAIYNRGTFTSLTGNKFEGNSAVNGGAVYNETVGTFNSSSDIYKGNSATDGGAIYNLKTATITNGTFENNTASGKGGAIYNDGTVYLKTSDANMSFEGNKAGGASNAIYNNGTVYADATDGHSITFNDAITSSSNAKAININSGSSSSIGSVNFYNDVTNSALNISGGLVKFGENVSIANDKLTINGGEVSFYNQNLNTSNDIALNKGTMNLHSTVDGATYINDAIVGKNTAIDTVSFINIYTDGGSDEEEGKFYINNKISDSTIKVYEGDLIIKDESYLSSNNITFYGCNVNTQNSSVGNLDLGVMSFTVDCDPHWMLDVDLANKTADSLTASDVSPYDNKKLTISSINLLSDATQLNTAVTIADDVTRAYIQNDVNSITTSLYKYDVTYDGSGGVLNFVRSGVSPGVVTSDVAQTQTFLLQTAIDRQFFANMESFMSFPLAQRESTICCALMNGQATGGACPISGNGMFSPIYTCAMNRGIWVKSFTSFENIPLRNGPNVSTVEYGTLIGMDAPMTYLKRGWVGNTSAYVGYLGSNQNYDNVGVSQNGVLVGLAENLVKGNNFLTLMASVGSSMGIANTPYGNDYFNSLFAGAAVKGGHNFEFKKGDYIIQPNLMLAYTFTQTQNYTTASGVDMTSKPLNAMQIAPGIRLIKNLKEEKGQVYLVGNFVYNVMDNTRFMANDVQLPQLSIAPYFEYGIGYQRVWENRLTGFFQTLLRGGGRNGVALQFGLRWAF